MASAAKTTATSLLVIGLVLGGLGAFLPAGENWSQAGDVRETEAFTLFTYTLRVTSDDTVVREDGPLGWGDDRLADDAGTGAMKAAGVVTLAALLAAVVGAILSVPRRTARGGGVVALFGALGLAVATALAVTGMRERTEEALGDANALDPGAGMFLLGGSFLLLLVGSIVVLGLRDRPVRWSDAHATPWRDDPSRAARQAAEPAPPRTLRCPDCGSRTVAPAGVVPTCTSCGFHRREPAPAVPATPASAFGGDDAAWAA